MILLKLLDSIALISNFVVSLIVISLKGLLVDNTSLLLELLILLPQTLSILLQSAQFSLLIVQYLVEFLEVFILLSILLLDVLQLFSCVTQNDYSGGDLLSELVQLFVSLFDLLIKSLVFDLKLLEIDQVKTVCQLLLFLKDLLLVSQSVSKSNVLQSVLMDLLVLQGIHLFPLIQYLLRNLLACTREHCILGYTSLELLKLLLDFMAFSLLLIQLSLEF